MIGTSALRKEGRAKVLGRSRYTDDKTFRCVLHGVTVRSQVPRGILKAIRFGEGIPWKEFTIVTAQDIPGENRVAAIVKDQPFLVEVGGEIHHAMEPVVLLAHPDKYMVEKGRRAVSLEVEELPAILEMSASDRSFKEITIAKGNPEAVWDQAALVIEAEYRTGAQEHLYIEPNGMLAIVAHGDHQDQVTVCGSMQCPYYVHKALTQLFNLPGDKIRIVQMETGGAFGGKEDYPSLIAGHAALLAWKACKPVKLIYDREEDMAATTKRHPSHSRVKTAFDADGHLLALDVDFTLDAGAYATLSSVVLSRGAIHAGGVYRCPNTRIHARAVATHTPPSGAFRGFGAPQSLFALERHLDVCAAKLGLEPAELRRRNFLKLGDTTATGQLLKEDLDLAGLLDRTLRDMDYEAKRKVFAATNQTDDPIKRGVGIAVFMHGCGFTGSGESYLASVAGVEGLADGRVAVLAGSTEIGQGKDTVFAQIAAGALKIPMDLVEVAQPDTSVVPDSGPTVASRSTMVVGQLVEDAAYAFKQALIQQGFLAEPYSAETFRDAVKRSHARFGAMKCYSQYHNPPHIVWDDQTYRGDAYPTYSWACYGAEVAVDTVTYEVKVEAFVANQEVGRVINPVLAAGQIEGGVAQGIGWALWESVEWQQGRMANNQMTNYIIPTTMDLPRIQVGFLENPHPAGPGGAKGLGELPMDGPAPALLNALQDALGPLRLDEVPMTPERLLDRLEVAHG